MADLGAPADAQPHERRRGLPPLIWAPLLAVVLVTAVLAIGR